MKLSSIPLSCASILFFAPRDRSPDIPRSRSSLGLAPWTAVAFRGRQELKPACRRCSRQPGGRSSLRKAVARKIDGSITHRKNPPWHADLPVPTVVDDHQGTGGRYSCRGGSRQDCRPWGRLGDGEGVAKNDGWGSFTMPIYTP
jgi:hypothetical protein